MARGVIGPDINALRCVMFAKPTVNPAMRAGTVRDHECITDIRPLEAMRDNFVYDVVFRLHLRVSSDRCVWLKQRTYCLRLGLATLRGGTSELWCGSVDEAALPSWVLTPH
jgi:hypothetical protein